MKRFLSILTLLLLGGVLAQANDPVSVRLDIFVVSQVGGEETFAEASTARPGQVVEYRLYARNEDETTLPAGSVVITGPIPEGTTFVANSATEDEQKLTEYSVADDSFGEPPLFIAGEDGARQIAAPTDYRAVRWTLLEPLEPGSEVAFVYRVTVEAED